MQFIDTEGNSRQARNFFWKYELIYINSLFKLSINKYWELKFSGKKFFRGYRQQSKWLSSKQSSLQKNADE